ncbi:MAG: tyrosine-type recombinase/integrase [Mycobacteriaceae bacterium]|jgi:integrase
MGAVAWIRGDGPLVRFASGFELKLVGLGYRPATVSRYLGLMGQLNRWLADEGLGVGDLSPARVEEFLGVRRAGRRRAPTLASLVPLLDYLSDEQVLLAPAMVATARDELLAAYRHHLLRDRGLTPTTVLRYKRFAKRFLAQRASRIGTRLGTEELTSTEVNDYLLEASSRLVVDSAKREAADLRALLRFLYLERIVDTDLGAAMPPVATWRGTRLPRTITATEVDAVLGICDRSTASGRRDYAILCLLARLGLRCGEVAALQLGDVDWRCGEIVVRGKARRLDRLPLPVQVGEALAAYLREDRPACACPQLILTLYAPPRPIHPASITNVVYRACRRAGLAPVGGHRLRHALATEMLRRGGNLIEIAQVLRQSDLGTTSDYAKVDRTTLRTVAQPWPGASR